MAFNLKHADEMKHKLNGAIPKPRNHTHGHLRRHVLDERSPTSVDWRTQGLVTPVKDQVGANDNLL